MHQDQAKDLFEQYSFVFFTSVPDHMVVSLDLVSIRIGPMFRGIKLVPPGFHILTLAITQEPWCYTSSFLFFTQESQCLAIGYNVGTETFYLDSIEQARTIRSMIRSYDAQLGAFPSQEIEAWHSLVQHITRFNLQNLFQSTKLRFGDMEVYSTNNVVGSIYSQDTSETRIGFPDLNIKRLLLRDNLYQKHLAKSSHYMDKTWILLEFVQRYYHSDTVELLGEFQLSFLVFWVCRNIEGFDHWLALLSLVCQSGHFEALGTLPSQFVQTLLLHLDTLDMAELGPENKIYSSLSAFIANLDEMENSGPIPREWITKLKSKIPGSQSDGEATVFSQHDRN